MSEHVLPADPNEWPKDPYELLGVPRNVAARDLKRAYTQLIRQFKPEQKPDEFRRIRHAYDTIQQFIEWGIVVAPAANGDGSKSPENPSTVDAPTAAEDEADRLWRDAIAGDPLSAYAGLRDLALRAPRRAELRLRLYWLATLFPHVDREHRPSRWLIEAVRDHGRQSPAFELLHRELLNFPEETLPATASLIDLDWPASALVDLAKARWWGAMRIHDWISVRCDFDSLEQRIRPIDEAAWLRLVIAAIDTVMWWRQKPVAAEVYSRCRGEMRRLEHRAMQDGHLFDRLDYLAALTPAWDAGAEYKMPPFLEQLIPLSWSAPFPCIRPMFEETLHEIVRRPHACLSSFDEVFGHAPLVLDYFGNLLSQYQERLTTPPSEPHSPAQLADLIAGLLAKIYVRWYGTMRTAILDFCLEEFVSAEMVACAAPIVGVNTNAPAVNNLRAAIGGDVPLRLVCWANRLFWA
jgi:hypothetical protein